MMMGFGFLLWLLVLGVLVYVVVQAVQGRRWQGQGLLPPLASTSTEDPKRLLQLRYARGEISREEYLRMLADLEQDPKAA